MRLEVGSQAVNASSSSIKQQDRARSAVTGDHLRSFSTGAFDHIVQPGFSTTLPSPPHYVSGDDNIDNQAEWRPAAKRAGNLRAAVRPDADPNPPC
jgi:hypothetical protein